MKSILICISAALGVLLPLPAAAQFDAYQDLAYVPRQGALNVAVYAAAAALSDFQDPSVAQLADAYRSMTGQFCGASTDGKIVNWFGKVHSVSERGETVHVELIVAERASIIAVLPADSDLVESLKAAANRWVRIDGSFIPDNSCLLQVPPLTLAAALQPRFMATIAALYDTVTAAEVQQLEAALPGEAWLTPTQD